MKNQILAGVGILTLVAAGITAGCSQEDAAEAAPQTARIETLVIPAGTGVVASLETTLSTETNHAGDPFTAKTTEPIMANGKTAIPAGATVHGVLSDVEASGRIAGRARMTLNYQSIVDTQGQTHAISALALALQAASTAQGDVEKIVAGTTLGAITGGIVGGGKGAAIGAGAGAGAGTILVLATKGEDVELYPGQQLAVHTTASISVQASAGR